ncbi:DNA polymerase epsilon subunit C [Ostrinia furnacalis]|uniref:DNA polymerase epsilon subunit C n=1 Tax=Ostrinia furnacalis TaxID=93504 RepID=UPI0010399CFA|nr:DNA polymerase epsilon subunit C [Ostrinia furnacalis]
MPSKKRKYNARFPAGRIKKIMQTDEEVGKVAQAVPIIISRTLELFVESLLSKAMQVTMARNAKTLSPSHVKQCILGESRFDFLRDLVKNIPDVSVAEEKEMMSAESSPNSSRFSDASVPPRRVVREDSNSSSSCDTRVPPPLVPPANPLRRGLSSETELPHRTHRTETVTSTIVSSDTAIDLTKRHVEEKPVRTANFYQETFLTDDATHRTVITVNPTYASPQPSTSYTDMTPVEPLHRLEIPVPKPTTEFVDVNPTPPPRTPSTPILNIDFSKNLTKPEIRVLDTAIAGIVTVPPKNAPKLQRQNSKPHKPESKKIDVKPASQPVDIDHLNSGNLQIDEDYDT